ncbi:SRPBCC family protein [Nocardia sp. NPDC057353]|uniref:SRPBCC family protein n=1 Tax=Nocardia sp. NPDC057353 TaxID=3346104 RepID=UPI003630271F
MTVPGLQGGATVALPIEQAFAFFTGSIGRWWPSAYHIGRSALADVVLEPRVGGRWYERGTDGAECDWGRALAWEPPHRLVLTWQINGRWEFDPDPDRSSEIEIRFTSEGPEQTAVALTHRHLDRLADGAAIRTAIAEGGGGWSTVLDRYAHIAEGRP